MDGAEAERVRSGRAMRRCASAHLYTDPECCQGSLAWAHRGRSGGDRHCPRRKCEKTAGTAAAAGGWRGPPRRLGPAAVPAGTGQGKGKRKGVTSFQATSVLWQIGNACVTLKRIGGARGGSPIPWWHVCAQAAGALGSARAPPARNLVDEQKLRSSHTPREAAC